MDDNHDTLRPKFVNTENINFKSSIALKSSRSPRKPKMEGKRLYTSMGQGTQGNEAADEAANRKIKTKTETNKNTKHIKVTLN